jgi:predicted metal-dependent hydrolase
VHELVHLLAPNHGKVFKSFLAAYLPDWHERDCALRDIRQDGQRMAAAEITAAQ